MEAEEIRLKTVAFETFFRRCAGTSVEMLRMSQSSSGDFGIAKMVEGTTGQAGSGGGAVLCWMG